MSAGNSVDVDLVLDFRDDGSFRREQRGLKLERRGWGGPLDRGYSGPRSLGFDYFGE